MVAVKYDLTEGKRRKRLEKESNTKPLAASQHRSGGSAKAAPKKKDTATAAAPRSKVGRLSDEFARAKKATPPAVKKAVKKTATAAKKTVKRAVSAVKKVAKKRAVAGGGRAAEAGRTSWYTTK